MNLRSRIAAGATAAAMASIFGLAGSAANEASSTPASTVAAARAAVDLPVTGTLPAGSALAGQLSNLSAAVARTGLPAAGTQRATAITGAQVTCKILDLKVLDLQILPMHVNVLGLVVNVDAVHVTIEAVEGPGNILGNLLCALLNANNPGGAPTPGVVHTQIIGPILSQMISELGPGPVPALG